MKILFGFLLAAFAVRGADDASVPVRDVIQRYVQARETRDEKALAALFTEDVDQLVSDGVWRKGREAVVKGTLQSSQTNSAHRTIDVQTVRFVTPDVAIADANYTLGERHMWTTILLKRNAGSGVWLITGIRNMLPAK